MPSGQHCVDFTSESSEATRTILSAQGPFQDGAFSLGFYTGHGHVFWDP